MEEEEASFGPLLLLWNAGCVDNTLSCGTQRTNYTPQSRVGIHTARRLPRANAANHNHNRIKEPLHTATSSFFSFSSQC